ncbi:PREDICTED: uncharacterized protein LOC105359047 [Ceratosolen solmsi marchali]|uniref:Uncharacterized protein LOC105359047 n=1 Tax=Ceratosolen solmsi marchali TaxID=326594 RepID=A0AAJ6YAZ8_9HYME|nr:PREDICTED: uncharacterized protein LOC105359047 [Ceratosolen solmsi marchali]
MEIHDDCLYKSMLKIPIPNTKPNIKDCLQPKEITQFEKLMLEIRSNFILKISDKEPGKSSFETSNIPSHIDPIFTSFGTRQRDPFSLSDIIHDTYNYDFNSRTIKYPGEQLDRKYESL